MKQHSTLQCIFSKQVLAFAGWSATDVLIPSLTQCAVPSPPTPSRAPLRWQTFVGPPKRKVPIFPPTWDLQLCLHFLQGEAAVEHNYFHSTRKSMGQLDFLLLLYFPKYSTGFEGVGLVSIQFYSWMLVENRELIKQQKWDRKSVRKRLWHPSNMACLSQNSQLD